MKTSNIRWGRAVVAGLLAFGLVLIATRVLPGAFDAWMEIAQPGVLILVEMVNNTIGVLIVGLVIAAFYGRPGRANAG